MDIRQFLPDSKETAAILACGGRSLRMGKNKLLINLCGKSVIRRSAEALCGCEYVKKLIVAAPEELWEAYSRELCGLTLPVEFASAGETRTESVTNAFKLADRDIVLIHDGARPLVSLKEITDSVEDASRFGSSIICTPVKDTIRCDDGERSYSPDRDTLYTVRTPQTFSRTLYSYALKHADGSLTDDAQLLDRIGVRPHLTVGSYRNIKLTTRDDIVAARSCLGGDRMRIGHGYDVHRLVEGRRLILGGVDIQYSKGLLGHSDADVLVHAIMDAILGAAALGDIGRLFPDNDSAYSGADSLVLLNEVCKRLRGEGYELENVDATVIAQAPKLSPYILKMRENIARAAGVSVSQISIKATTEEGLGFSGSGEGIAAHAVALIK